MGTGTRVLIGLLILIGCSRAGVAAGHDGRLLPTAYFPSSRRSQSSAMATTRASSISSRSECLSFLRIAPQVMGLPVSRTINTHRLATFSILVCSSERSSARTAAAASRCRSVWLFAVLAGFLLGLGHAEGND